LHTDEHVAVARTCSFHFRDGEKNNGPTILFRRFHQSNPHLSTPETKKRRNSIRKTITMQVERNISGEHLLNHESISATIAVNDIGGKPLNLSLNSSSNLRYIKQAISRQFLS